MRNGNSVLTLTNSIIRGHYEGLTISFQADATITGSTFSNNRRGIAVDTDADVANLSISNNIFSGNNWATGTPTPAGLDFADVDDTLIAINNDWGSSSGPTIASNPSGTGDRIIGNVTYSPWTGQNTAPTLSYIPTSGYASDGVEPNISFKSQSVPVFKVLYSDADNVVSYVRLVTASSTVAMATSTGGVYEYTPPSGTYSKGTYSYHFEASDGTATARLPASGELSFEVKNIPVILVPGIAGTELWKGDEKIWPNFIKMLSPSDSFMDVLLMTDAGLPTDDISLGDILKEPISNFYNVFQGLIDRLQLSGYQENDDLFVFPYDWRLDIRNTSQQLKNKIIAVKSMTDSTKVNIVAHSMGGLLSKQYILDNGSDSINKIIFIGTPNLGAPKAAKTLMFGDSLGVEIFIPILSADRIRIIGQNMPSIYQLLPSQEYFNQIGNYYTTMSGASYDYQTMNNFLINNWKLNSLLLQDAKNFHIRALDLFDASGLDAYNINGCNTATIKRIFKRDDGIDYSLIEEAGDGTVPLESSQAINVPGDRMYYFNDVEHATMPSANGIRELIGQIIAGSSINLANNATQDSSVCKIEGKLVSVHSPVNLHIYDSSGNHVGRGENGEIDYNITGVAYEEIGENKFVFLPTSGGQTYRVELDGTGVGTYSLRVSKIEDNEVVETAYYSDLPVNTSTEATVTLASSVANTVLQVDQNGTGSFAQESISAVLDSTQATDTTQPSSTITVSGGQRSVTVSLAASDDNAGVLKIEYSTNGGATWQTYASSFIITTIGDTTVEYRATDRAGNVESTKSRVITVTPAPNAVIPILSSSGSQPVSQVLGEQIERPRYTKEIVLDALSQAKTETLLDYLNKEPNSALEEKIVQDYSQGLALDQPAINFITYGTKSTDKLGVGERVNVLRSYQYAFGQLPQTPADWQDAVNVATGQLPIKRNAKVEQEARAMVRKIYGKIDEKSVLFIAYGLRPTVRDINKEQSGLSRFGKIFGRLPSSVFDWNIFRKLVY